MTVHSSKHYAKSSLHTPLILLQKDVNSSNIIFGIPIFGKVILLTKRVHSKIIRMILHSIFICIVCTVSNTGRCDK